MENQEKEPKFKVVDKRRVNEDGDVVLNQDPEKEKPKIVDKPKERPELNFSIFIQSLAHQAMMGLGLLPWPDSGLIKKELNLAKETIDILLILQAKTKNNLTKEEEDMLNTLVYQLQLAFLNHDSLTPKS